MATKLLYLENFDVVSGEAKIIDKQTTGDGRTDIILDQTCFYPRGGGQDWDTGTIGDFAVEEVRLDADGVVHHIGEGDASMGDHVQCSVNTKRRSDNTRLHSAGHVIDMVMSELKPGWTPARGAHYPHMSFVEYEVPAGSEVDEAFKAELQTRINNATKRDYHNQIKFIDKADMAAYCRHIPDNVPTNKPSRIVLYADDFGIPCGGTHVRQLTGIGDIMISKIKIKKGLAKVSYAVAGINW